MCGVGELHDVCVAGRWSESPGKRRTRKHVNDGRVHREAWRHSKATPMVVLIIITHKPTRPILKVVHHEPVHPIHPRSMHEDG